MTKCPHCGQEMKVHKVKVSKNGWIYIPELKVYVEKDVHYKGYSYNQLKEIYGKGFEKMLLTKKQVELLRDNLQYSKTFKLKGTYDNDFFIQQYDKDDKKRGYVADFCVGGGRSYFYSYWDSGDAYSGRGVRFCRKKNSKSKR